MVRPAEGEVVVRIAACGVCFTDTKIVDELAPRLPLIPGHEPVGVIHEVGHGVESWSVGDRVGVHSYFSCGQCPACLAGEEEACVRGIAALAGLGHDGGYAEYLRVPAAHVVPLPDALAFAEAAPLLCAGLTTFSGLRTAGIAPGKRVVVVGVGGLGHLAISIAAALGATVYAVSGSPDKVAEASARGAVFTAPVADVARRVKADGGADIVLNTVDDLSLVGALVESMAKQGTIVLAAGAGDVLPVTPTQFNTYQLRVVGTFFGSTADMRDLLELAARTGITPQIERYPLEQINAVHERLRSNQVRYRAVVEFDHA